MTLGNQVPDKTLLRNVERKISRKIAGANHVSVAVRSGDVTISGTIRHEHERRPILSSVNSVPGVRRVLDQLQVAEKKKFSSN